MIINLIIKLMKKDFTRWHEVKEKVDNLDSTNHYFNERDIWWCYCGVNIGMEQDGKGDMFLRPVLVFKKFNRRLCWVLPLSTRVSKGDFFFPLLSESNTIRMAIIPQMRMIDIKRLINKIDLISNQEYGYIKEKVIDFIR
jgi:mRNA interferase MazF